MRSAQKGISLVLILVILTAIGGVALTQLSVRLRSKITLSNAVSMNAELGQSRQALLSYAMLYPYLYGAKGAGVGHFPCPDTDSLNSGVTTWSSRNGPNPPCSSSPVSIGHLPSHISFPEGRYMIHASFAARVNYAVSAHVINNPSLHAVNPSLMSTSSAPRQQPVLLQQQASIFNSGYKFDSEAIVSKPALLLAVRVGLAAWFRGRMHKQDHTACRLKQNIKLDDIENTYVGRCAQIKQLALHCRAIQLSTKNKQQREPVAPWQKTEKELQGDLVMLYVADAIPHPYQCEKSVLAQIQIERVPAIKHWFVKNGWPEWIQMDHDVQCVPERENPCKPRFINLNKLESLSKPLQLHWFVSP